MPFPALVVLVLLFEREAARFASREASMAAAASTPSLASRSTRAAAAASASGVNLKNRVIVIPLLSTAAVCFPVAFLFSFSR